MAGRVIALDIDSASVRLLQTEGKRVERWASLSLEPGLVENGSISDPQALGALVKQLMRSSGIEGKSVVASISGLYSVSRFLSIPGPPGGSTSQAVLEAAKGILPLAPEELYLSWQTIAASEGEQQVLVIGMPRNLVDAEVQSLRSAGVTPSILDHKAIALTRTVNKEQALILNVTPSSFDMVVVVGGIPEVMRTIPWRQDDLTMEDRAEHLATALELTIGFYNSRHPNAPLNTATPLFITGPMEEAHTLVEMVQSRTGHPIEPLAPPLECPAHLPVAQYAVNIGLALREIALKNPERSISYLPLDINLLPEIYRPRGLSARQIYSFFSILAAIVLLFPIYQAAFDAMEQTTQLRYELSSIEMKLERARLENVKQAKLMETIQDYQGITAMRGSLTEDLWFIEESKTPGIELSHISLSPAKISLKGTADTYSSAEGYAEYLRSTERFSSVELSGVVGEEGAGGISFQIEAKPQSPR